MTADERRGVILDIICARRYETIDNLAFELDASRRSASLAAVSDLHHKRPRRRHSYL